MEFKLLFKFTRMDDLLQQILVLLQLDMRLVFK